MTSKYKMSQSSKALMRIARPLTRGEEQRAINAAASALTVNDGDPRSRRFRILWAALRIDKPENPQKAPPRRISVVAVDYDKKRNLEIVTDERGRVIETRDLRATPPFSLEEIKDA